MWCLVLLTSIGFCEHTTDSNFSDLILESIFDSQVLDPAEIFEPNFEEILYFGAAKTCLKFNGKRLNSPKKLFITKKLGADHSFRLLMHFNSQIHYYIGDSTYQPSSTDLLGRISPGTTTDLVFSKVMQKTLGPPFGQCLADGLTVDSEFFKETISSGFTYRQVNCFDVCFRRHYLAECTLGESVFTECYNNFSNRFDYNQMCLESCPLECDIVSFNVVKQENSLASTSMLSSSVNTSQADLFNVWIYFNSLELTEIVQIPKMTGTDLVSEIGGTLGKLWGNFWEFVLNFIFFAGLFLGLSFVSIAQILEIVS